MGFNRKRFGTSVLFFLPALTIFFIFFLYPIFSGLFYSFTNWDGLSPNLKFIGLQNYKTLLDDRRFLASIGNTFKFAIVYTILQNLCGMGLALLMDRKILFRNVYRAIFYLPSVISALVVGVIWTYIYNPTLGINRIVRQVGFESFSPMWLGDVNFALYAVVIATVLQTVGSAMVIYLAGLQGIPEELYESAHIDGVNSWQRFRYITLPLLSPAITIGVVLTTIWSLKVFDIIFVMTQGGPGYATDVIATAMYDYAFRVGRFAYGTAIGVVLCMTVLLLTLIQLTILRKREVQY